MQISGCVNDMEAGGALAARNGIGYFITLDIITNIVESNGAMLIVWYLSARVISVAVHLPNS